MAAPVCKLFDRTRRHASANVLVVDDEPLIRLLLRKRFKREGCEIVEAASAHEALERFTPNIDLALVDLRLSDGDGLMVLRRIKNESPDTAVILMTAFSSIATAVEAMRLGAFHYVSKPFDLEEITLLANGALETTRRRRSTAREREARNGLSHTLPTAWLRRLRGRGA